MPAAAAAQQAERANVVPWPIIVFLTTLFPLALAYAFATGSELRVVAGMVGLLGVGLIMWQPFLGLILLIGLIYVRLEEVAPVLAGMRLTLLISVATLVGATLQLLLRKTPLVKNPMVGMLLGFAATACVSSMTMGYLTSTLEEMGKLVAMALLVINLIRTPDRYRTFVTWLIIFTTYLAGFSIYRYFTGGALMEAGIQRSQLTGIFSDPNDLAAAVVFGLALAMNRIPNSRAVGRWVYSLACVVMTTAILLTNSRGAMISLAVVVVVFVLSLMKNKGAAILAAVFAIALLGVVAPSRMKTFDSSEESANSRFELWLDGLEELKANPILGMGFRQFSEQSPSGLTAHNSFVLCFSELGLVGYFFFIGCLYYALRRPREGDGRIKYLDPQSERDLFGARMALIGFLAAAFWLSRTYIQVTWLFIALGVTAQIVTGAGGIDFQFRPKEKMRDWGIIMAICLGSIAFIKVISHVLA